MTGFEASLDTTVGVNGIKIPSMMTGIRAFRGVWKSENVCRCLDVGHWGYRKSSILETETRSRRERAVDTSIDKTWLFILVACPGR